MFKYFQILYYKSDIEGLLDDLVKFWDYRSISEDFFFKVKELYRMVKIGQMYFSGAVLACTISFFFKPVINANNRFLFLCWTFSESYEMETAVLAGQYYIWFILYHIVSGYDSIYFSYCAHIIVQLRILKYKFQNMPVGVRIDDIVQCVEHHNLLLS